MARRAAETSPLKATLVAEQARRATPNVPYTPKSEKKLTKVITKRPPAVPEQPAPEDLQAVFGENLKAARLKSGLKQSDVADRTGLTQQRLSLIESGHQNLTLKTMMRLAQVVNCNVSTMLLKAMGNRQKD